MAAGKDRSHEQLLSAVSTYVACSRSSSRMAWQQVAECCAESHVERWPILVRSKPCVCSTGEMCGWVFTRECRLAANRAKSRLAANR